MAASLSPDGLWSDDPMIDEALMDDLVAAVLMAQCRSVDAAQISATVDIAVEHFSAGTRHVVAKGGE